MRTRRAPRPNATLLCRRIAADMAKKLPELARGMGQAVREFQKAKDGFRKELKKAEKSEAEKQNGENEKTSNDR